MGHLTRRRNSRFWHKVLMMLDIEGSRDHQSLSNLKFMNLKRKVDSMHPKEEFLAIMPEHRIEVIMTDTAMRHQILLRP